MYAETADYDVTERAVRVTDMSPEGRYLARAITSALHHACLTSRDLDFVNAHGTSPAQNASIAKIE